MEICVPWITRKNLINILWLFFVKLLDMFWVVFDFIIILWINLLLFPPLWLLYHILTNILCVSLCRVWWEGEVFICEFFMFIVFHLNQIKLYCGFLFVFFNPQYNTKKQHCFTFRLAKAREDRIEKRRESSLLDLLFF